MKSVIVLCMAALLTISAAVSAQSLYQLNFQKVNDTTGYHAFFVQYPDGSGLVRIKYYSPVTADWKLLEMEIQEQYPDMKDGNADPGKLFYSLINPVSITGADTTSFQPPLFCFKKDAGSVAFEPWGTAVSMKDPAILPFSKITVIENNTPDKNLVLEYFTRQDAFYKKLFETKTRALTPLEKSTTLNLLVVANSNDPEIGSSCAKDMDRMVETFNKLAGFLGIAFISKTISGKDYNKRNVDNALATLNPSPNDIVIFYYSGHGFRKPKDGRRFPYIDLRPKTDNTYMLNSLNMEDIFDNIKKKGARFNLILSDCCNTNVEASNATGSPVTVKKGFPMDWCPDNCRTLFLNPKPMSILATAADVNKRASSNNEFGGFFSYFFKASVENSFSYFKPFVSWDMVLQDAVKQTSFKAAHTYCDKPYIDANICSQSPVYKIK